MLPNRWNGPNTGSLYFGDDPETCALEIGLEADLSQYGLFSPQFSSENIVDFVAAENAGENINSLLMDSGSGGHVPTQEIANEVYAAGLAEFGTYTKRPRSVNLMLFKDHYPVEAKDFTRVVQDDDESGGP